MDSFLQPQITLLMWLEHLTWTQLTPPLARGNSTAMHRHLCPRISTLCCRSALGPCRCELKAFIWIHAKSLPKLQAVLSVHNVYGTLTCAAIVRASVIGDALSSYLPRGSCKQVVG
jgi:hypothetical protein